MLNTGLVAYEYIVENGIKHSDCTVFAMILMSAKSLVDIAALSINYLAAAIFKVYGNTYETKWYALFIILFIAYTNYEFHKKAKEVRYSKAC